MKCACDVCDLVFGDLDPRSPDGYCAFCSSSCFPLGEIRGKKLRTALGKTSRQNLHAMARVADSAQKNLPHDPKKVAEAARAEAAEAAVTLLGPLVQRAGKIAVEKLRDKIRGR